MLDIKTFEDTLRTYLRQKPFVPFTVELDDGRLLSVPQPVVVFCEGIASYITPDDVMVDFTNEEVVAIRPTSELVHE